MKKHVFVLLFLLIAIGLIGCSKEAQESTPPVENKQPENIEEEIGAPLIEEEEEIKGTDVTEEGTLKEFQEIAEKLYYNFLFKPSSDRGTLTEKEMQLFAISYIYQYEYNELRFDSDKFVLYIPEQNVSDIIKVFFDYEFTNHQYPEDSSVTYENGYYLMKARNENLGEAPKITEATKLSGTQYKLSFSGTKMDQITNYEILLEDKENRWVILEYKSIAQEQ